MFPNAATYYAPGINRENLGATNEFEDSAESSYSSNHLKLNREKTQKLKITSHIIIQNGESVKLLGIYRV